MKNLRLKCSILKRVVILLSAYEILALALGSYFMGTRDFQSSLIYYVSMVGSYVISYELGFLISHWIIRLELNRG